MVRVTYEWAIEESDRYGDIFNVDHADSLSEAIARRDAVRSHGGGMEKPDRVNVALLRIEYDSIGGELDRQYAYLNSDGTLPEIMETCDGAEDGPPVPRRFHDEARRCLRQNA